MPHVAKHNQIPDRPVGVIATMADRFGMDPRAFESTIKSTIMPANKPVSNEEIAAFLLVSKKYNLNPFTKEIYAFPGKDGGISPIVSIDGWLKIINGHPQFDGMEFTDHLDDHGSLTAVTCRMFRKDRQHPTEVTEYMAECKGTTEPWKRWPARMLRHKATIQCGRYAFGFSGIMDPDEADRLASVTVDEVRPATRPRLADVILPARGQEDAQDPEQDPAEEPSPNAQHIHDAMAAAETRKDLDKASVRIAELPEDMQGPLNDLYEERAVSLAGI